MGIHLEASFSAERRPPIWLKLSYDFNEGFRAECTEVTEDMMDEYQVPSRLNLLPAQTDLLSVWFSHYYARNLGEGMVAKFFKWMNGANWVSVAEEYKNIALRQELVMDRNPQMDYLSFLKETTDDTESKIFDPYLNKQGCVDKEGEITLNAPVGKSEGIRGIANRLCLVYIQPDLTIEELQEQMNINLENMALTHKTSVYLNQV